MKFDKKKRVGVASTKLLLDRSLRRRVTFSCVCNLMILADAPFSVSIFI